MVAHRFQLSNSRLECCYIAQFESWVELQVHLLVGLQNALAVHAAELGVLVGGRHEVRLQRRLAHRRERSRAGRLQRRFVFLRRNRTPSSCLATVNRMQYMQTLL